MHSMASVDVATGTQSCPAVETIESNSFFRM